ncbi:hypothetical protein GRJ2_000680600 [Grus japonensis]|uniref:Dtw domain-containing protein 2 n=1 Tax=Grus japonensis TaxID=30415 RepID=A0ABC9WAG1_GRUJA
METIQQSAWRQLMQAAASLDTLCTPQVLGTRTYVSTDWCFFIAGQKDCSVNMDCQALFPALTVIPAPFTLQTLDGKDSGAQLPEEGNLNPSHSSQFDASASNRCPELGEGSQVSRRSPEVQHKGIPATPPSNSASLGAQLKCLYANARTMGNKQEELETCAHLQAYDHIGIMEMWWDGSCDWSVGMEGYRLFRKDRQGRQGEGVTLYLSDQLECMELNLGMDEEPTESLWVRIKGKAGTGDTIVGVCYRPPDQEDRADDVPYRQIGAASCSQALVLMGDFNHPNICWRGNTAGHKQSRRFLEYVYDNFLLQVIEEPMRRGAMLDIGLTIKEGLVGNVELKGSLGCSDHEMVLRAARREYSKLITLDFRRADFRDLLGKWAEEEEAQAPAGANVLTDTLPTTAFSRGFLRSRVQ